MKKKSIALMAVFISMFCIMCSSHDDERDNAHDEVSIFGKKYIADFGDIAFLLDVDATGGNMTYTWLRGDLEGTSETVKTTYTRIRNGVYMVTWQEADGTTVTHVRDHINEIVYTNISTPNANGNITFVHLKGTLKVQS